MINKTIKTLKVKSKNYININKKILDTLNHMHVQNLINQDLNTLDNQQNKHHEKDYVDNYI